MRRAITLGLVVLVAAMGGCADDEKAAEPRPPATAAPADGEWPVYFVPRTLPDGMLVLSADERDGGQDGSAWLAVVGRASGESFTDVIRATVSEATSDREVSPSEDEGSETRTINGQQARVYVSDTTGAAVDWFADGMAVAVSGPAARKGDVIAVAAAIRLGPTVVATELGKLPAGYDEIGTVSSGRLDRRGYTMTLMGGPGQVGDISVDGVGDDADFALLAAVGDRLERRTVRNGKTAWLSAATTDLGTGDSLEQRTLAWSERPGLLVVVGGAFSEADILAVAEGLEEADEQTWRAATDPSR